MKWKVSWLESLVGREHIVNETIKFDSKMFNKVSNIRDVSEIKVTGRIFIKQGKVNADLDFTGTMILPCANTGEDAEYDFNFKIEDILDEEYTDAVNYDLDYIDLLELAWQRLIVEAPTKFVKNECTSKSGKSWRLITEEEFLSDNDERIDPRFEKLKDLFNDKEE